MLGRALPNRFLYRTMKNFLLIFVLSIRLWCVSAHVSPARVRLPYIFSSGMVLQREQPLTLRGWSDAGEEIEMVFRGKKYRTKADNRGDWAIELPKQKPGGPYEMSINDTVLTDVWVGDVILCAGQSNMELPISRVTDLFADEVSVYENPAIRQLRIPTTYTFHGPQDDLPPCCWEALTPGSAMDFSALGYFLARKLYDRTCVPVGIVNNAVGGSTIESWLSEEALGDFPSIAHTLAINKNDEYIRTVERGERLRRRLWVEALNREDPGCARWSAFDFPDSLWKRQDIFDLSWTCDAAGRPVNGSTWWRRHFSASGLDTRQPALLRLGCWVDADSVFVNGVCIGATSYRYPPRKYIIPPGILHENGDNVVAVRLISYTGRPGVVPDKPYKIEQEGHEIPLTGEWLFCRGAVMPSLPGETFFRWQPTALYNSMMAPLLSYGMRAVVWYQGESNTGDTRRYADLLPRLIGSWRALLGNGDLPFVVVQLPRFMPVRNDPTESDWAAMREVQRLVSLSVPRVGLAVTIDTGEWNDIHPLDKKTVADRVARELFRLSYDGREPSSPMIKEVKCEGGILCLRFDTGGSPLVADSAVTGFSVAGSDDRHVWAHVLSVGEDTVCLQSPVGNPCCVRYAWADNPAGVYLYNEAGLPASPFEIRIVP